MDGPGSRGGAQHDGEEYRVLAAGVQPHVVGGALDDRVEGLERHRLALIEEERGTACQ